MLRALLPSALALLGLACRSPANASERAAAPAVVTHPVELRLDRATYRPGDTINLTLTNASQTTYAFNPCTRTLERRVGSAWRAAEQAARICTMEAWLLPGAGSISATTEVPKELQSGDYRLILALTAEGAGPRTQSPTSVVSERFTVEP